MYEDMIRLVGKHHRELLTETHLHLAKVEIRGCRRRAGGSTEVHQVPASVPPSFRSWKQNPGCRRRSTTTRRARTGRRPSTCTGPATCGKRPTGCATEPLSPLHTRAHTASRRPTETHSGGNVPLRPPGGQEPRRAGGAQASRLPVGEEAGRGSRRQAAQQVRPAGDGHRLRGR